ncbi:Rtt106-domain-containing protein [Annulohypoxylon stygium]|nr:Rtt106-domain-containing protein [Annulohypoxylon stygium]
MAGGLDVERLDSVFKSRPDILKDIHKAADSPARVQLFNKIATFVYEQIGDQPSTSSSLKRRRVDIEPSQNGNAQDVAAPTTVEDVASENILLEIKDISVSIPQRKKFELCFTPKHLFARIPGTTAPVPSIVYAWKNIEYAFYLPVPEKSQVQHNYILFPRNSFSLSKSGTPTEEPLVFTVSAGAPKPGSIGGPNASAASAVSDSYTTLFHWALNKCLQAAGNNVHIVAADPTKFHSKVRQPHRPKEPAVHVKAFRGSKDGYLFFLETGILWGFKKPLLFIPLDKIAALSYTSVLQRTFNVVVEVFTGEGSDTETTEEIEFAMLDQEDYGGINEDYVMRHRLQDRSMADQRKAKRELAENAKGKKDADGEGEDANGTAGEDGMTELERAQMEAEQQLQDEEDEDEEDYDPGSEGESEGSGTSDDDDDDDEEDAAEDDEMDDDE